MHRIYGMICRLTDFIPEVWLFRSCLGLVSAIHFTPLKRMRGRGTPPVLYTFKALPSEPPLNSLSSCSWLSMFWWWLIIETWTCITFIMLSLTFPMSLIMCLLDTWINSIMYFVFSPLFQWINPQCPRMNLMTCFWCRLIWFTSMVIGLLIDVAWILWDSEHTPIPTKNSLPLHPSGYSGWRKCNLRRSTGTSPYWIRYPLNARNRHVFCLPISSFCRWFIIHPLIVLMHSRQHSTVHLPRYEVLQSPECLTCCFLNHFKVRSLFTRICYRRLQC